jgi:hypothetical protein
MRTQDGNLRWGRPWTALAVAALAAVVGSGCGPEPADAGAATGAGSERDGGNRPAVSAPTAPAAPSRPPAPAAGSQAGAPAGGSDGVTVTARSATGPSGGSRAARPPALIQKNPGWGLDRISQRTLPLNNSYRANVTGQGVTVYLIDSGLYHEVREFEGRASLGVDLVGDRHRDGFDEFAVAHGTFVAGIVGGRSTGVTRKTRLVAVRTLAGGEGAEGLPPARQTALIIKGVDWVRTHARKPAVVNMSLNQEQRTPALDAAVTRLIASGVTVVVSAGNDGGDACPHSPAGVPAAITVAASDRNDRPWEDSNQGRCVTVFAPGVDIRSVNWDGSIFTYEDVGATSWAAPYVTGAAALYLSTHPNATPAQVKQWVVDNSTKGVLRGLRSGTPNRLLYTGGL